MELQLNVDGINSGLIVWFRLRDEKTQFMKETIRCMDRQQVILQITTRDWYCFTVLKNYGRKWIALHREHIGRSHSYSLFPCFHNGYQTNLVCMGWFYLFRKRNSTASTRYIYSTVVASKRVWELPETFVLFIVSCDRWEGLCMCAHDIVEE